MQRRPDRRKAIAGNGYLLCYNTVAQADGLTKQLLVVLDGQQTFGGGIFRVEQPDIDMVGQLLEVVAQHAIIEQYLHMVGLTITDPFLARLLLDKQLHVVGHQVNTASQA